MAGPIREMVESAISDGAVAAVLVWETADGRVGVFQAPNLVAVQRGLLLLAINPTGDA